jgi:CyaY protein
MIANLAFNAFRLHASPSRRSKVRRRHTVTTLSEQEYQALAFPVLGALVEALDEHPDEVFAELAGDVLTIEFEDQTRYVVNSHAAARQIWLAAERSAWHFDYRQDVARWVDRKSDAELWSTLEELVSKKLGRPAPLRRPALE